MRVIRICHCQIARLARQHTPHGGIQAVDFLAQAAVLEGQRFKFTRQGTLLALQRLYPHQQALGHRIARQRLLLHLVKACLYRVHANCQRAAGLGLGGSSQQTKANQDRNEPAHAITSENKKTCSNRDRASAARGQGASVANARGEIAAALAGHRRLRPRRIAGPEKTKARRHDQMIMPASLQAPQ